ncbi:hypothetical protein [Dyella tabacisoli]|uniref:DUF11 domain-containing protein n=1 Tax=Dyella tabacisoli TaxID=2282381 RepID=A0A369UHK7_9GAMM|nr:hypothetical protein [Dyella tabacisoli]RDD80234.1 hypothetical protein DVJ77_18160 [Dyella tabacisoli]
MSVQARQSTLASKRAGHLPARHRSMMRLAGWLIVFVFASAVSLARASAVDLFVVADSPSAKPNTSTTMHLFVGNVGAAGTGNVELTFVTPAYVNVHSPLPSGCQLLYENTERSVPSIVLCTLPALGQFEVREVDLNLDVDALAPPALTYGSVMIYPAANSVDIEQDIHDNAIAPGVEVALGTPVSGANINLYATGNAPAIPEVGSRDQASEVFTIGNNGLSATTGAAHFGIATPFFINDVSAQLPSGCIEAYSNPRPNVPEVVICTVPAGLAPGDTVQFPLRFRLIAGGPTGPQWGVGAVSPVPGSTDVDSDRADNLFEPLVNVTGPASTTPFLVRVPKDKAPVKERLLHALTKAAPLAPAKPRLPKLVPDANVDLNLSTNHPVIAPGAIDQQILTVGNNGQSASGNVRIVYALPLYANVAGALPSGCVYLYNNPDYTINQIVQCLVAGPAQNQQVTLTIPIQVSPNAPAAAYYGAGIVVPAAPGDVEQNVSDNVTTPGFTATAGAPAPVVGSRNAVDLYVATSMPNLLANAPANVEVTVGNKGPHATTEKVLVTFITQEFVNHSAPLPDGCSLLYENADPAVPEVVQCLIDPPIDVNGEVNRSIPIRLVPGAPSGVPFHTVMVRPQTSVNDVEIDPSDNMSFIGARTSRLPLHTLTLYLHGNDIAGTAGGFTMNTTPASSQLLSLDLINSPSWFSDPPLVGNFTTGAAFSVTLPCTLSLGVSVNYSLASTALDGSDSQPVGSANELLSLCLLGSHTVSIPVTTPLAFDNRRLKLTISTLLSLNLNLQLGSGAYVQGTNYEGTP